MEPDARGGVVVVSNLAETVVPLLPILAALALVVAGAFIAERMR